MFRTNVSTLSGIFGIKESAIILIPTIPPSRMLLGDKNSSIENAATAEPIAIMKYSKTISSTILYLVLPV